MCTLSGLPSAADRIRHGVADGERRAYSPLGIVAMGNRRTEYRHYAVADMLVDAAAVLFHQPIGESEEPLSRAWASSGSSFVAQHRIASKVGEKYGDLPTLAFHTFRRRDSRPAEACRTRTQRSNRLQQLQPMAERKPHFPEMFVCEVGDNVNPYRVPSERVFVLLQPEAM